MPKLHTDRLLLHTLTSGEARALVVGEPLPEWSFADGYPLPDTADGAGLFLLHLDREWGVHLLVRREDGLVIGDAGFVGPPKDGAVVIGYEVVPGARRQGYATEAIGALSGWALAQPEVGEVRAHTLPDNEASIGVLLRAGFREQEAGRNVRRFALSAD